MTNRPSVPEIITVNSEELQTLVRDLLPSQNGFGSELQATNVITPVIDLTATAEGSTLRSDLQTALAYGSQTEFNANNSTVAVANSPGFYRCVGTINGGASSSVGGTAEFQMTDGVTPKTVYECTFRATANASYAVPFDLVFWVDVGITLNAISSNAFFRIQGSVRQIADSTGAFVHPSGFPL